MIECFQRFKRKIKNVVEDIKNNFHHLNLPDIKDVYRNEIRYIVSKEFRKV